jgi:hypothetical protein
MGFADHVRSRSAKRLATWRRPVTEQKQKPNVASDEQPTSGTKQRRPYQRPELVQYGALQEVTRAYITTRNCRTGCLVTG